jgi:hypothetical protein
MEAPEQSLGEPFQEYFASIGVKTMQDFTLMDVSYSVSVSSTASPNDIHLLTYLCRKRTSTLSPD